MIIYIAGPMTGKPGFNRDAFAAAAKLLREAGHTPLNPAWLPTTLPDDKYMPICTAMIDAADAIYMLNGWQASLGARCERLYAKRQGKIELLEKDVEFKARKLREEEANDNDQ